MIAWGFPFLFFPSKWLTFFLGSELLAEHLIFMRLLGWAYLALCVGYYGGYQRAQQSGQVPVDTMYMGIASNGGAAVLLTWSLFTGAGEEFLSRFLLGTSAAILYGISGSLVFLTMQLRGLPQKS